MTLKTLVTGVAAAAVVGAAAAGVTSIASRASSATPAVQPVVLDIPMPQAPAPDLQAPLLQTLQRPRRPAARSPARRPTSRAASAGSRASPPTGRTARRRRGQVPADLQHRRHRPGGRRGHRQRHRHGRHWRQPPPRPSRSSPARARPAGRCRRQSALALLLGGRLIHPVHRTRAAVLSAATIVAALGLSGCGDDTESAPSADAVPVTTSPPTVARRRRDRGIRCRRRPRSPTCCTGSPTRRCPARTRSASSSTAPPPTPRRWTSSARRSPTAGSRR